MYLAYIDESGDTGADGSQTYSLGCVLMPAASWPSIFDQMIDFRRHLNGLFGVPVRAEIKANYLLRNGGPFRPLGLNEQSRYGIYRAAMRLHVRLGLTTFAVVINKVTLAANHPGKNSR